MDVRGVLRGLVGCSSTFACWLLFLLCFVILVGKADVFLNLRPTAAPQGCCVMVVLFFMSFLPEITSRNRKRCRVVVDRLRGKGPTIGSPLSVDWVGFTAEESEMLKAGYRKRSFYGGPDYKCTNCGAVFWFEERGIVDARACIDEWRLHFIMKANNDLRAENLQGVTDAVGKGQTDASSLGKKNILPSSFTGGRRYMIENFQDAIAISRVFGPPDLFTTFTCNPKWPEITEALCSEPGQMPSDRADLPVRVYHMKLNDYIHDIKSGEAFGPVVAVLHTVEFQKRGLPHAHILIWLDRKKREEACAARGLLGDDLEWYSAFDEALTWGMGDQLRRLFVTILVHCGVNDENAFFEKYWSHLAEDIKYNIKRSFRDDNHVVPPNELRDILLDKLTVLFSKNGSNILDHRLPLKTTYDDNSDDNDMITDELSADPKSELLKAETIHNQLNPDQLLAYKNIIDRVVSGKTSFFFVSGYGGTGKTFLWSSIISYLRGKERIVLTVASSGVAALLFPGGRTAHSRFKIPISLDDNGTCDIKRSSKLAEMIESASLIIWDEALMTHRRCFEALDHSLRDILSADDPSIADMPFGGKVMVLGGDLRQILPVIEGGTRSQVINAAITNSPLWHFIEVLHLNVNMRLPMQTTDPVLQAEIASFAGRILSIGDGTAPCVTRQGECEPSWVTIPDDMLIHSEDNRIGAIVNVVYTNFAKNCSNRKYLCQRAILTTTNDLAQEV
ncbi:uncharacterized protein [Aegilops tauschii subsp. strangulata]|uniref:uncharacterized protein n=1 Tax=Aegilops tauschii subsp. strangulata TaxID=200361 RepID=UPI003CC87FDA